jgi:Zn-dependent M28 family amino/carboxypeptidase
LATNLAQLYRNGSYTPYKYRVRFCWWAAEEIGLVGSIYHVEQAQNKTEIGESLKDYLINLNYDMLGSPNFLLGIYNGSSAKVGTPTTAINGSIRITQAFEDWFTNQGSPMDFTEFDGRSDYGPFLAAGIVSGGLFSGADGVKTVAQRDKYEAAFGPNQGGFAEAIYDPCYHKLCDSVKNINPVGYMKMVQAAAYVLDYLGQNENLAGWLYPNGLPSYRLSDDYVPNSDFFRNID